MKHKFLSRQKYWHSILSTVNQASPNRTTIWKFPEYEAIFVVGLGFRYTVSVQAAGAVSAASHTFGTTEITPIAQIEDSVIGGGAFDSQISNQLVAFGIDPLSGAFAHEEHLELNLAVPLYIPRGSGFVANASITVTAGNATATLRPYARLIPVYDWAEVNDFLESV